MTGAAPAAIVTPELLLAARQSADSIHVAPELAEPTVAAAKAAGYDAWLAGRVKRDGARKAVVVPPLGLTFEGETLQVR